MGGRGEIQAAFIHASRPIGPVFHPLGQGFQIVLIEFVMRRHPLDIKRLEILAVGRHGQHFVKRCQGPGDERIRIALGADDDKRAIVHVGSGKCGIDPTKWCAFGCSGTRRC
jgi:hypothetical protein